MINDKKVKRLAHMWQIGAKTTVWDNLASLNSMKSALLATLIFRELYNYNSYIAEDFLNSLEEVVSNRVTV